MTVRPTESPALPGGVSTLLTLADSVAIASLFARCEDFFILQDGEPATSRDTKALFTDVPSERSASDQLTVGYWKGSDLMGLATLLIGYPHQADWYLGFLLLDPSLRGEGVGAAIFRSLEEWASQHAAKRMLVAVLEQNQRALLFWQRLGFESLRITGPTAFKGKAHLVIELAKGVS